MVNLENITNEKQTQGMWSWYFLGMTLHNFLTQN